MNERTNGEWVSLLAARDEQSVDDLRTALTRGLTRVLAGRAGQSSAEDFAQEAVLRVLDSLDSFRGESKFLTWALTVGTRVAFTELRKARYRDVSLASSAVPEPAASAQSIDDGQKDMVLEALRRLIGTVLTERQRAFIEAELSAMPMSMVVEQFGTNRNAVYKLGHDARMKLKQALEAEGITADEVRRALAGASHH